MFGRGGKSLKELIRLQHEELRRWDEEARRRQEKWEEESRQWCEESRRAIERSERALEESQQLNRELLLRNEKVYTNVLLRLEQMGDEIREHRDESRAQTKALLKLLDRFDGPGGLAAA